MHQMLAHLAYRGQSGRTKAQRKLFFNLHRMQTSTAALSPVDARTIAKELDVKPEEVVEMESGLSGRDVVRSNICIYAYIAG
jgi:DNA-directed RNA polymerase sigma subunit (sigma70/sigma32)